MTQPFYSETSQVFPVCSDRFKKMFVINIEGKDYYVKPLPFQSLNDPPEELHCLLSFKNDRLIRVTPDLHYYINTKYKVGDKAQFRVKNDFTKYCELIDEYGFTTYLQKAPNMKVYKNKLVSCEIVNLDSKQPRIIYDNIGYNQAHKGAFSVSEQLVSQSLQKLSETNRESFAQLLLDNDMHITFEESCHRWLGKIEDIERLRTISDAVSDFMERSDFLFRCKKEEAPIFEERLTLFIEKTHYYIAAKEKLSLPIGDSNSSECYVKDVIECLKLSGVLFQPDKKLEMLQTLFRLDKQLMAKRMHELLRVLKNQSIEHWKREPFRSGIVKLMQVYVEAVDKKIYNQLSDADQIIENAVGALILQLLLTTEDDEGVVQPMLNKARLLRYVSYLQPLNGSRLIERAFEQLFNSDILLRTPFYKEELSKLPYSLLQTPQEERHMVSTHTYDNGKIQIYIDNSQIVVRPAIHPTNSANVLPPNCLPWHDMTFCLHERIDIPTTKSKEIPDYKMMWNDIERHLFAPTKVPTAVPNRLLPDQQVDIRILEQDHDDPNIFHCRVVPKEGENNDTIDGIVYICNTKSQTYGMVKYNITNVTINAFNPGGEIHIYESIYCGEDRYGRKIFNLKPSFDQFLREDDENGKINSHLVCSIGHIDPITGAISAVSLEGYSVNIKNPNDIPLKKFDVVYCRYIALGYHGYLLAEAIEPAVNVHFDMQVAFSALLNQFFVDVYNPTYQIKTNSAQQKEYAEDEIIGENVAAELMLQVGRIASLEHDHVCAYNYLGAAKILARILNREQYYKYYNGRMELILLLHHFAINGRIDEDRLQELERGDMEFIHNNATLQYQYNQLKLISFLDRTDKNTEVWEKIQNENDKKLRELASLVLAHNLITPSDINRAKNEIDQRIYELLNVRERISTLKNYGEENLTTEFKTSIVYPPGQYNHMLPDLEQQTHNIMIVVAEFLNTEGGKLYLGVRDSGQGEGLAADLKYHVFSEDKDKYIRHIHKSVVSFFGQLVGDYIHINFDADNNDRDICIISVDPFPNGVRLDEVWYVRQNSERSRFNEELFHNHNIRRHQQHPEWNETSNKNNHSNSTNEKAEQTIIRTNRYDLSQTDCISLGYLNILEDGRYILSEWNRGNTLLSMPFYDTDQFILFIYESGRVSKIPIEKFKEKEFNTDYNLVREERLLYVLRCKEDEALLRMFTVKNKKYVRTDSIDSFRTCDINQPGDTRLNIDIETLNLCAILKPEELRRFRQTHDLSSPGCDVTTKQGQHNLNVIHELALQGK